MSEASTERPSPLRWGSESARQKELEALWPRDAAGEAEQAVFLAHIPDFNNEADFTISMLTACGIPAFKSYNNEGALGKLIIGTSAFGASVYVPASLLHDAKALLEQSGEEALAQEFSEHEPIKNPMMDI